MNDNDNCVKTYIRIKPDDPCGSINDGTSFIQLLSPTNLSVSAQEYHFQRIFSGCTQEELFTEIAEPLLMHALEGFNVSIFCYGQTGTETMQGPTDLGGSVCTNDDRGIIQRTFEFIFRKQSEKANNMSESGETIEYLNKVTSFVEIYNEQIFDLMDPSAPACILREDFKKGGIYVHGSSEEVLLDPLDAQRILEVGAQNRTSAETAMNRCSSRSHLIMTLSFQSRVTKNGITSIKESKVNLVDLAGSERQKSTSAVGVRLKEGSSINKSLLTLGTVIDALVDISNGKQRHVHYRDSKLTMLLKDSLGGNSKSVMIATISQNHSSINETQSTLRFASRAKLIKNNARINQLLDAANSEKLREEIIRLQKELDVFKNGNYSSTEAAIPLHPFNLGLIRHLNERNEQLDEQLVFETEAKNKLKELLKKKDAQIQHERMILRLKEDQISRLKIGSNSSELERSLREEIQQLRFLNEQNPALKEYALKVFRLETKLQKLESVERKMNILDEEQEKRYRLERDYISKLQEWEAIYDSMKSELEGFRCSEIYLQLKNTQDLGTEQLQETQTKLQIITSLLEQTTKEKKLISADFELSLQHIDKLEQDMKNKACYFESLQKEIQTLKTEHSSNEKEISRLQILDQKKQAELLILNNNVNEITLARETLQSKYDDQCQLNDNMELKLITISENNDALSERIASLTKQITDLSIEKANQLEEKNILENTLAKISAENAVHFENISQKVALIEQLEKLLQRYLESSMQAVMHDNTQSMKNVELIQELSSVQSILQNEKNRIEQMVQEHNQHVNELVEMTHQVKQKLSESEAEIARLKSSNSESVHLCARLEDMERINEALNNQMQNIKLEKDLSLQELSMKIDSMKVEIETLEDDYEQVVKQKLLQEKQWKSEKQNYEHNLFALSEQYKESKKKINEHQSLMARSANEMKSEINDSKEDEKRNEELARLLSLVGLQEVDIARLKAENEKLVQHSNHKQKLQYMVQLKRENNSLKQEVRDLTIEIGQLKECNIEDPLKHKKIDREKNKENSFNEIY